jgi:hypothetical protein
MTSSIESPTFLVHVRWLALNSGRDISHLVTYRVFWILKLAKRSIRLLKNIFELECRLLFRPTVSKTPLQASICLLKPVLDDVDVKY